MRVLMMFAPLALCALTAHAAPQPSRHDPIRTYTIDLDMPPKKRYTHIIEDTANGFNATMWEFFETSFGEGNPLTKLLYGIADTRGKENPEMQAEIEGLAAVSKLPVKFAQAIQMLYELQTLMVPVVNTTKQVDFIPPGMEALRGLPWRGPGCTGIIATCSDGAVYHARNLDFAPVPIMSKLVYIGVFKKGGQELFRSQMVAGYVQVVTAARMNADGYTLERNTRYSTRWGGNIAMITNLLTGVPLNGWTLRKVVEEHADFDGAVAAMETVKYASTEYTIVSGVKKGVILSRDPEAVAHKQTLGAGDDGQRSDYILITNFDFFFGDIRENGDGTGGGGGSLPTRRAAAEALLTSVPQGALTPDMLYSIINAEYVFADTVFQSVMGVETGHFNVSVPIIDDARRH